MTQDELIELLRKHDKHDESDLLIFYVPEVHRSQKPVS